MSNCNAARSAATSWCGRTRRFTRAGKRMQLSALGGGVEPVFVDLLKDGQTMLSSQIEMQNGHGAACRSICRRNCSARWSWSAYRFGAAGLPVRKTRTVLVQQARQIEIRATLDQDEYRPGVRATIQLSLTDNDGQPVPGRSACKRSTRRSIRSGPTVESGGNVLPAGTRAARAGLHDLSGLVAGRSANCRSATGRSGNRRCFRRPPPTSRARRRCPPPLWPRIPREFTVLAAPTSRKRW
jgi:hypothetical protein